MNKLLRRMRWALGIYSPIESKGDALNVACQRALRSDVFLRFAIRDRKFPDSIRARIIRYSLSYAFGFTGFKVVYIAVKSASQYASGESFELEGLNSSKVEGLCGQLLCAVAKSAETAVAGRRDAEWRYYQAAVPQDQSMYRKIIDLDADELRAELLQSIEALKKVIIAGEADRMGSV